MCPQGDVFEKLVSKQQQQLFVWPVVKGWNQAGPSWHGATRERVTPLKCWGGESAATKLTHILSGESIPSHSSYTYLEWWILW